MGPIMLCWLPGADPATRDVGERLVKRVLDLYGRYVSEPQRRKATIAICELAGLEVAVVFHVSQHTADRIAGRLRKAGVAATGTSGDDHAEMVLHQREPGVQVMGISNKGGPCSACETYFGNDPNGFANVYWDSTAWV